LSSESEFLRDDGSLPGAAATEAHERDLVPFAGHGIAGNPQETRRFGFRSSIEARLGEGFNSKTLSPQEIRALRAQRTGPDSLEDRGARPDPAAPRAPSGGVPPTGRREHEG
jgi:hypothetical protein